MLLIPIQASSADLANLRDMEAGLSFSPFSLPCTEMQPSLVSDYSELPLINFQLFISLLNLISSIYYAGASFSEMAEKLANFPVSSGATSSMGGLWGGGEIENIQGCSRSPPQHKSTSQVFQIIWLTCIPLFTLLSSCLFQDMVSVCFGCSYSASLHIWNGKVLCVDLTNEEQWFAEKCMMGLLKPSLSTDWPSFPGCTATLICLTTKDSLCKKQKSLESSVWKREGRPVARGDMWGAIPPQ